MADQRITQLTALSKAGVAANDVLPISDISAGETKKVAVQDLVAAGVDLIANGEIDLAKLDQASATKLGTTALVDDAITAAKLADDSSVAVQTTQPAADNFEGRGYFNSTTGNLQVFNGSSYQQVVLPTAGIGDLQITTGKLADGAVTTAKVSALGTAAYADSSVTTTKLADGSVTAAKIAANSITATEVAPNAIGASELGNDAVDTAAIIDAAVTEAKIGGGAVTTAKLGDLAVTNAKIANTTISYDKLNLADGTVPGTKIANSSITASQLGANAVTSTKLSDSAVTTVKIADGAITAAKIAADAITASQIAAGAIGTSELASAAVTYGKIQATSTTDVVLGRSSAGGGTIEEIPVTAAGRALLDDADAATQRSTLGLGTLATADGTWVAGSSFSGTSSGTNTGDQTITLTGDVTGTGTGSFAAQISNGVVSTAKLADSAVTSDKIASDAVTSAKLADQSAAIVASATPSGAGDFVGQQWINTSNGIEYTWTGTQWLRQAGIGTISVTDSTPLAFAVAYPDAYSANVTVTLDTQQAATVFAGPASGVDTSPTFRALQPGDLPDATASTKGIIQPGSGLSVSSGTLNHSNSVATGTYTKVTVDAQGHVSAGATLSAADVPALDASKITTGTFGTGLITDDAVTGAKLSDYSTAQIGEVLPVADYIGQLFFNPLDKNIYLWDGNVWQPVGVSLGELIFAGTYNATLNEVVTTTTVGAAAGLVAGDPLPAASSTLSSYYVVVATGGTGTAPAPTVVLSPPDIILCDGVAWTEIDVSSTYVAQTASNVGFAPAGTIASTNVQAAIEEAVTEAANASNLTSGTVAVARGGTGTGSYTKGDLLAASGAAALSKLGVGSNGQVLRANSATATGLEWGADYVGTVTSVTGSGAISVATGTTTPAISVATASTSVAGIVQLSDSTSTTSSVLAATSTAVKSAYDLAAAALPTSGGTVTGNINLDTNIGVVFEGTTADGFETTLLAADPTADRTIYLPNVNGTIVTTGDTATVTNTMLAGSIADSKLSTISTAGKVSNSATTATNANTASAIVARDASGNFSAGTITASLTGAASLNVLKAGDLLTGALGIVAGTAAAPGAYFSGDTNTGIYSSGADQLAFTTAGTQRVAIDASGRVLVGPGTAREVGGAVIPTFAVETLGQAAAFVRNSVDTSGGIIALGKSRGATAGSVTVVQQNDILGEIRFCGANGTDMTSIGAHIRAMVDGAVGTAGDLTDMPTRLVFSTTPDGEATAAERMRIDQAGRVGIDVVPASNTKLDINGTYVQNIVAVPSLNIDCATGNYFTKTINGASTFTVSNVPASRAYAFTLELTHTSGAITWFSGVVWPNGTAPTLTTGKVHLFMFVTGDGGTTWRASSLINY